MVEIGIKYLVKEMTNAEIEIGRLESRLHKGYLRLENVTILNPKGFEEPNLAEFNFILLDIDLPQLLKGDINFRRLFIDLDRIYIVLGERGTNLVEVRKDKEILKKPPRKVEKKIRAQDLRIKISRVIYKNFRTKPPKIKGIYLGLQEKYSDVRDVKEIMNFILTQNILKTTFSNLNFDLKTTQNSIASIFDKVFNIFK